MEVQHTTRSPTDEYIADRHDTVQPVNEEISVFQSFGCKQKQL